MARNKITVEWNADGTGLVFTGSHRQPTLAEIHNYCIDNHLPYEGVYVVVARLGGEWWPEEDYRSVELIEFGESCPVCGKPFPFDTDICPVCLRKWNEEVRTDEM